MLENLFTNTTPIINTPQMLFSMATALFLGVLIAITHKYTARYTKGFLTTLATLPLFVAILITLVNGNLGTGVAIMGVFSLVRFRSLPGSAKEILSIVFAMTVGLTIGIGYLPLAVVLTIFAAVALIAFDRIKIFDRSGQDRVLVIVIPEDLDYAEVFTKIFKKYVNNSTLMKVRTINMGSMFELSYDLKLKRDANEKEFVDALRTKNANMKIVLSRPIEGIDL